MIVRWLFLLLVLLLSGCSLLSPKPVVKPWLPPLPPESLRQTVAAVQKVTGERDGRRYVLLVQIEVEPQRLVMVASTAGGNSLFSLEYRRGELHTTRSPLVPEQLDPVWVLADFQLTFWPLPAIQQALASTPCEVRDTAGGREMYCEGVRVARIEYSSLSPWEGRATLYNERWGYQYTIDTLQWEPLQATSRQTVGDS